MKIKHLLIGMLAMAAAVACKQDEPVEEPVLEVNKTAVAIAATAGESTFEVTANNAWSADADADWVSLDPANGVGSEKAVVVKVTAEDNTAEARTATVTVKSGNITRTVKVAQAAAAAGPGTGDGPDLPVSDWAIVGSFTGEGWGWDPAAGLPLYVLDEDYFVLYGLELAEGAQWKFLQGGAWGGAEVGADRTSVEPNTIQAAGSTNIYVTTPGKYDVYLSADATKYYVMSEGKTPAEATEPADAEKTYTVAGTIKDSNWDNMGAAGLMTKEGDYYVAKNVPFVTAAELYGGAEQIEFKVCNTGSWDGAYGLAEDAASPVNTEIAVVAGGAKNIAIAAAAGTYDVYFDEANAKVWVMTQGAKPGETPVQPEKETAQLVTFLSFQSNVASGQNTVTVQLAAEGLSMQPVTSEYGTYDQLTGAGKYLKFDAYSADGTLAAGTYNASAVGGTVNEGEFSIGYDTTVDWGWGPMEMTNWGTCWMTHNADGSETGVKVTDGTIIVAVEGDVYTITLESSVLNATYVGKLSKDAGETPETPEPEQPELEVSTWALVGSFNGWDAAGSTAFLSVLDADYFVYYGFEADATTEFKFVKDGKWASQGGAEVGGNGLVEPNTIQPAGGSNIKVTEAGTYDIYLSSDLAKFYVMTEGKLPSEATEPAPVENQWGMMGCFVDNTWAKDVPMTKEGEWIVAKGAQFTELTFKIRANESWADATNIGLAPGSAKGEINTKVSVATAEYSKANLGGDAADIKLNGEAGTYDVYFSYENLEVYVMTPGLKPGETPAAPVDVDIDGKQWLLNAMGTYVLVDLGLYEEDAMVIALPAMDGSGFACHMYGAYEIEKTDAKSGNIIFTQYDVEFDEFMDPVAYPYSELSESVVYVSMENVLGDATPLPFVAVEEPYEIMFDNLGGGDGPSGAIENGEYWFFNGEKVMAPLAEGETTGVLPAGNVISGASTEKNIFTLTYDPDWSYYTIQDSYGRYLGQTDETGNITVTSVLPTDDTYAFYLWCVEPGYGEATSIYNSAYYYDITYSAADNNWVLVDGGYEFPETLPVLVKAENPVEEPVVPEGPKVVTAAEFNAATDNNIEYQVSGTISGIYQAYSSSYNNISIYISDETGEILAYRVSCAGITDPANTLTKGDLITVKGKRTLYNEKPQMAQGCVIVEHTDVVVETPAGGATLSFADKANRTVFTTSQQVWEQNGVKLINDKASSTSNVGDYAAPARFYQSSKLTVEYPGITKIEFTCNNGSYATELKNSIKTGTVTVSGSVVTVVLDSAADSFVVASLAKQVRMDSLTVYAE